ncbi:unnamed protein product [Scytosiphon promiscuus]
MSPTAHTKSNKNDRHAYDSPGLSAFTSGDAHNGCRALFNGTAGWAYIGPAGMIDPTALPPGTVSYSYDAKRRERGLFSGGQPGNQSQHDGAGGRAGGGGGGAHAAKRPGEGLGRKLNDARMAYLDADDLQHLVHEAGELSFAGGGEGGGRCDDGEEEGGGDAVDGKPTRKGRPIVLTLQAIFAATSPSSPSAAAGAAAAAATGEESNIDPFSAPPACASATAAVATPDAVEVADHAQFPPLMLRGSSAERGPGLFLAPPITMVKNEASNNSIASPAEEVLEEDPLGARGGCAEMGRGDGSAGGSFGRVSCSEAVAATSVAEGQSSGTSEAEEGGTAGGMSRIGWWLRWATTTAATTPSGADEDGEADGGVSLETTNGIDGWQVVSSSGGAGGQAGAAEAQAQEDVGDSAAPPRERVGDDEDDDDDAGSWCDFTAEEASVDSGADVAGAEEDGGARATEAAPQQAAIEPVCDIDKTDDNHDINDGGNGDCTVPLDVSPNLPRSFRDMLMAPSASGAVKFSDSKELQRARATGGPGLASSTSSSGPTLVDGGVDGGAVFLWRKAAAGEGGRAADRSKSIMEDEDPYYARKRVGAFAFKTKPRGKAHK